MLRKTTGLSALLAALLFASGGAMAADAAQEPIFGSQLMTEQERTVYRARMWAAEGDEARAAIRAGSVPFPVEIDFSTNMTIGGTTART